MHNNKEKREVRQRDSGVISLLPVVCQVVKATLDEAHADLPVGKPADQGTEQLLCLTDQALRQVDLRETWSPLGGKRRC